MMYTLIIDAGSTKMEWALLKGEVVEKRFTTEGFNPNYSDSQKLNDILSRIGLPLEEVEDVYRIHYYGSGCLKAENASLVGETLKNHFSNSLPLVSDDMKGAAHALLGNGKGIACILGTGANSCRFDGKVVTDRAVSLGYLVGDEGSGCYIGRKLARAFFYDLMPLQLKLQFKKEYQLEINDFINKVYHQPEASKYLAGFTRFAGEHQDQPFIQQLVKGCFNEFIEVFVLRYDDCHELPIGFVGSVAYHFQSLLKSCLEEHSLTLGPVIPSPMEGLIHYHSLD